MNYIPCIESVLIVRVQAGYGKQETKQMDDELKITKNSADDYSFKELGNMFAKIVYLQRGINEREKQIDSITTKIATETERLTKNGYHMSDLKITIIDGVVL